jgi:hypothetical protein
LEDIPRTLRPSSTYEIPYLRYCSGVNHAWHCRFESGVPHGDRRAPLTDDDLRTKFEDCLEFAGFGTAAAALHTRLTRFGDAEPFTGLSPLADATPVA